MISRQRLLVVTAVAAVLLPVTVASVASSAPTPTTAPTVDQCTQVRDDVARRRLVLDAAEAAGGLSHGQLQQIIDERAILAAAEQTCAAPTPAPSGSASPTASPTTSPTASPAPTSSPTPSPTPTAGGWPGAANTGVPAGVTLTAYTGPCTITVANTVIDAKDVTCDLDIATTGVQVTRSRVHGYVGTASGTASFTVSDSEIVNGNRAMTGVCCHNYTAIRVEVTGGNRAGYCEHDCTLQDSWLHGTYVESNWHASAYRMEQNTNVIHNTLACDWSPPTAQDGGCSADLTGYPDFAPIKNNLIQNNLFVANVDAAFCAYGGASAGKPYSSDPTNATYIRFVNNVFQRGANNNCAAYGPIDSYDGTRTGNEWTGNVWDSGESVVP